MPDDFGLEDMVDFFEGAGMTVLIIDENTVFPTPEEKDED